MSLAKASEEVSAMKASTSSGEGGRPIRSKKARRIRVRLSAAATGLRPFSTHFSATKESMGVAALRSEDFASRLVGGRQVQKRRDFLFSKNSTALASSAANEPSGSATSAATAARERTGSSMIASGGGKSWRAPEFGPRSNRRAGGRYSPIIAKRQPQATFYFVRMKRM